MKITPNPTGLCLNCSAPVPVGQKFCCDPCGKDYRWRTKYSKENYHKKPRQKEHVCYFAPYAPNVCFYCRNKRKREAFGNRPHNAPTIPHASRPQ